jgi:hypothetical protein
LAINDAQWKEENVSLIKENDGKRERKKFKINDKYEDLIK